MASLHRGAIPYSRPVDTLLENANRGPTAPAGDYSPPCRQIIDSARPGSTGSLQATFCLSKFITFLTNLNTWFVVGILRFQK